jgi:hypothetical protein
MCLRRVSLMREDYVSPNNFVQCIELKASAGQAEMVSLQSFYVIAGCEVQSSDAVRR